MKAKALCFLLMCACMLWAQTEEKNQKPSETEVKENIEVWATSVKTSSVRLENEAIDIKQADHISDLLRVVPGVDVGGAHSLNQRITIRSLGDRDLRIAIDGASQNSYMYHHMGNLQIHADILKSVDIEVGTRSVINGGLGGAVNFETKDAKDLLQLGKSFGARLQTSYGDNAAAGYSLTGYGKLGDSVDFLAYYNGVNRDNYAVGGDRILDAAGQEIAGTDGEVRGLEGDLSDALFKLGWDLSGEQRLEATFETYEDEGDYSYRPDMGLATDLAIADNLGLPLTYPTEFTRDTATLNYEISFAGNTRFTATAYSSESELMRDESGLAAVFGGAARIQGVAKNSGLNFLGRTAVEGHFEHSLTYGVKYLDYDTDFSNDVGEESSEQSKHTAFFIEDRINFGNGFTLTPGVRYEIADVESVIVDDSFNGFTAGLAFEHRVNQHFAWRASGTQLFKAPEIGEVFLGAGLGEVANADIEEETGLNTEIGFDYQTAVAGKQGFSAGLTLFRTSIDDYIYDYAAHPEFRSWNDNVGDLEIDGFEAYVGYAHGGFSGLLSHDSAESELAAFEAYSQYDGARLDRTQGDSTSLALNYRLAPQRLEFHYDVLRVDDVNAGLDLDGATLNNSKDGYTVHNISLRWSPERLNGLAITVGVDNLFDEFYASQSSRTGVSFHPRFGQLYLQDYEPGRNLKATLAYRF